MINKCMQCKWCADFVSDSVSTINGHVVRSENLLHDGSSR